MPALVLFSTGPVVDSRGERDFPGAACEFPAWHGPRGPVRQISTGCTAAARTLSADKHTDFISAVWPVAKTVYG